MKRLFTILAVVLLAATMWAQSPEKMSYQAVIRDGDSKLVTTQVGMQISILQGSESGTAVYVETQTPTPNINGLVTIEIGTGTTTDDFSAIDWAAGPYYILTETAVVPPLTTYTITGTSQLLSVPYSLHAKSSGTSADAVKITGDQTIAGNKTFTGTTTVPTPVNTTDAATKAYVDALVARIEALELNDLLNNGLTDSRDGNNYNIVKIGDQIWMAENLAYLPVVHSNAEFFTQGINSQPGYGVYGYDGSDIATAKSQENYSTYGVLYNWWAAMDGAGSSSSNPSGVQGVCPTGWHLPSDDEWTTLENFLIANGYNYDGTTTENKIAKSLASTTLWTSSTTPGAVGNTDYPEKRNATGFTALPGGYRNGNGSFSSIGTYDGWWPATESGTTNAWRRYMVSDYSYEIRLELGKVFGNSVRCVRD